MNQFISVLRVFKGSNNQFRNNEFSRLFDQLAQLLLRVCSLAIVLIQVLRQQRGGWEAGGWGQKLAIFADLQYYLF